MLEPVQCSHDILSSQAVTDFIDHDFAWANCT
jgi:hypothetical protein